MRLCFLHRLQYHWVNPFQKDSASGQWFVWCQGKWTIERVDFFHFMEKTVGIEDIVKIILN